MKSIGIVTDSHSSISQETAKKLGIYVLPMPFYIDDECFYEDISLKRDEFFQKLEHTEKITTSCPSPAEVMDIWNRALQEYDEILYIPISSGLSSSCTAAVTLAQEKEYKDRIYVVDNGRVSAPLHCTILDALELIQEGYCAAQIKEMLEAAREDMVIYIMVDTLEYLKRGGRVSAATASLGTLLHIKPILELGVGQLHIFQKSRGIKKAKKLMLDTMHQELETRFKESYEKGELYLMAASSTDPETAAEWVEEIKASFPGMDVLYDDLSLGVCCHIGPGGLGIGCSCKPKRI